MGVFLVLAGLVLVADQVAKRFSIHNAVEVDEFTVLLHIKDMGWTRVSILGERMRVEQKKPNGAWVRLVWPTDYRLSYLMKEMARTGHLERRLGPTDRNDEPSDVASKTEYRITDLGRERYAECRHSYLTGRPLGKLRR